VSEPAVVKTLQVGKEWDDKKQKVVKLGVQQVACGSEHGIGLLDNGAVVSWGGNRDGEVGNGGKSAGIGASLLMEIQQHRVKSVFAGGRSSACLS